MRRLLASTAAAVSLAVLASACSSDSGNAAVVNGEAITDDVFSADLDAYAGNELFLAEQADVLGQSTATVNADFARSKLREAILYELIRQEAEQRDLQAGEDDLDEIEQFTFARFSRAGAERVFDAFPESFRERALDQSAALVVLRKDFRGPDPTDETLRARYDEDPRLFGRLCAGHILVGSEAEALAVLDRLDAGEDFGTLAEQVSQDPSAQNNGGSLNGPAGECTPAAQFDADFVAGAAAATPGEPSDPVQTQFGWHIIKVDRFEELPFEEVRDDVRTALEREGDEALNEFLQEAVKGDIEVSERYGTWDSANATIVPPGVSLPSTSAPGS